MPSLSATYRSISWELLADAAVLPQIPKGPMLRFTPQAAHSRFDSTCGGSGVALISRWVLRRCSAANTEAPPSCAGRASSMSGSRRPAGELFNRSLLRWQSLINRTAHDCTFTYVWRFARYTAAAEIWAAQSRSLTYRR